MESAELVVHTFYEAFSRLDFASMKSCYHSDAVFQDPVFGLLQGGEIGNMWEMLCRQAKEFELTWGAVTSIDEEYVTCPWTAHYVFSRTGRKVKNRVKAYMRIADGRILEHTDQFSLYSWARHAFGISGWILGWSPFFQNKVRQMARKNLERFKESKKKE